MTIPRQQPHIPAAPQDPEVADLVWCVRELVTGVPVPPRRIRLRAGHAAVDVEWPDPGGDRVAPAPVAAERPQEQTGSAVRSPLVGTFYSRPEPGAPPFAQVGAYVVAGQQVGIVEAMKLMNAVEAESAGHIAEVLVADGDGVEYDQVLLRIVPAEEP